MHIIGILWPLLVLAAPVELTTVEDFEAENAADRWVFSHGPEFPGATGELSIVPEAARSGGGGARLSFDFSGGGAYVQATVSLPADRNLRWINLWIRKPVPNRMTFRCVDARGETFQKGFNYPRKDWQHVRVDLRSWAFHWGEGGNGIFDAPAVRFGILVERADGVDFGQVFFDSITGEGGGGVTYETPRYVYRLPSLSDRGVWRMSVKGPADAVGWHGEELRIDWTRGVKSITFSGEQSLLGKPREIRFPAIAAGADLFATFVFYSHFQAFERKVLLPRSDNAARSSGSGPGGGPQERESSLPSPNQVAVPLGAMERWDHYGGENDGVVRLPLRLSSIRLEPPDPTGETSVTFGPLEIETLAEPGEEFVLYGHGAMVGADEAEFRLLGRSLLDRDLRLSVPYSVYSFNGKPLGKGKTRFLLRGGGAVSEAAVQVPVGDEPFGEAEFEVPLPGAGTRRVAANATRSLPRLSDPEPDPSSIFGMGLYLYRYPATDDGYAQMDAAAAMAASAGVKWSREEFQWARIEPERGKFNWDFYDRMVETATRNGIAIYGLLCYWTPWTKPFTDEGISDYCRFVAAAVDRYRGRIRHWEVWNEPNIFFWSGPKEVYTQLLREAYGTIKNTNPDAVVLGCSTAGIDMAFVRKVVAEGGPFDVLTIHPYRGDLDDAGFIRELRATKEAVSSLMGREIPVWITEMGWPTSIDALSEQEAARRLARVYLCSAASGAVDSVSWYDFRNDGNDPLYNEANFGVVHRDLTPKPGYRALATICRRLAGLSLARELDWGKDTLAYLFEGGGRRVIAAWSTSGDRMVNLRHPAGGVLKAANLAGSEEGAFFFGETSSLWLMEKTPVLIEAAALPELATEGVAVSIEPPIVRTGEEARAICKVPKHVGRRIRVQWNDPLGWSSDARRRRHAGEAFWELTIEVPRDASPGRHRIGFSILIDGQRLDGWTSAQVVPHTLEI